MADYKQNACEFMTSGLVCKGCGQLAFVMCSACEGFYCPDCPRCACDGYISEVNILNDERWSMYMRLKDVVKAELEEAPVSKPQSMKSDEMATEIRRWMQRCNKWQPSPEQVVTRARRSMTKPKRFDLDSPGAVNPLIF